jgi:hypothetical protein
MKEATEVIQVKLAYIEENINNNKLNIDLDQLGIEPTKK